MQNKYQILKGILENLRAVILEANYLPPVSIRIMHLNLRAKKFLILRINGC